MSIEEMVRRWALLRSIEKDLERGRSSYECEDPVFDDPDWKGSPKNPCWKTSDWGWASDLDPKVWVEDQWLPGADFVSEWCDSCCKRQLIHLWLRYIRRKRASYQAHLLSAGRALYEVSNEH